MIKFENGKVTGIETAIKSLSTMYSLTSDSYELNKDPISDKINHVCNTFHIGDDDMKFIISKFRNKPYEYLEFIKNIMVTIDITAPIYWWQFLDLYISRIYIKPYSLADIIQEKKFDENDFSIENLGVTIPANINDGYEVFQNATVEFFKDIIQILNINRTKYINTRNLSIKSKYLWQIIQLLPTSYNQKKLVTLSYYDILQIYKKLSHTNVRRLSDNKNIIIKESYKDFYKWMHTLPYTKLITMKGW